VTALTSDVDRNRPQRKSIGSKVRACLIEDDDVFSFGLDLLMARRLRASRPAKAR
jgi:hypothetical protein